MIDKIKEKYKLVYIRTTINKEVSASPKETVKIKKTNQQVGENSLINMKSIMPIKRNQWERQKHRMITCIYRIYKKLLLL